MSTLIDQHDDQEVAAVRVPGGSDVLPDGRRLHRPEQRERQGRPQRGRQEGQGEGDEVMHHSCIDKGLKTASGDLERSISGMG